MHTESLTTGQQKAYERAGKAWDFRTRVHREVRAGRQHNGESPTINKAVQLALATPDNTVIYLEHKKDLDLLCQLLTEAGLAYVRIDGDVATKARLAALTRFRDPDGVRVCVGTKALEVGLNLQVARVLISVDTSYNPMRERQREGRLRRVGSPYAHIVHHIVNPDTERAARRNARVDGRMQDIEAVLRRSFA